MEDSESAVRQVSFQPPENEPEEAQQQQEEEDEEYNEVEERKRMAALKREKEEEVYNQFVGLCDNLVAAYSALNQSMEDMMETKDLLLAHPLPPVLHANLTLKSSKLCRTYSDMKNPMNELTRLVKNYAQPWHLKSEALKKLHSQYDEKKRMLNVALKKLQLTATQMQQFETQKTLNHWEKLYCKLAAKSAHGRRWKFRFAHFKKKADQGFEHLQSYLDLVDKVDDREATPIMERAPVTFSAGTMGEGLGEEDDEDDEEESGAESDDWDGSGPSKSKKSSGKAKTEELYRERTPVETDENETWTHEMREDRYLCVRVTRIEGAGFAKRPNVFLDVAFNRKRVAFDSEQVEVIMKRERPKSGLTEGGKSVGADSDGRGEKADEEEEVRALDCIEFPLEEKDEELLVEGADVALKNVHFNITESQDGETLCASSASLQSIIDSLPPTVDLPDYFGEGDDEGEFLLADEPTELPLFTPAGGLKVGAIGVHFYYGVRKRPFIAEKAVDTDPSLVESVVERLLGVDLQAVSLDKIMRGVALVNKERADMNTSPIPQQEEAPSAASLVHQLVAAGDTLAHDAVQEEESPAPVQSLTPVLESPDRAHSERDSVAPHGVPEEEVQKLIAEKTAQYDDIIQNYEEEVSELRMTVDELKMALENARTELEHMKTRSPQADQRRDQINMQFGPEKTKESMMTQTSNSLAGSSTPKDEGISPREEIALPRQGSPLEGVQREPIDTQRTIDTDNMQSTYRSGDEQVPGSADDGRQLSPRRPSPLDRPLVAPSRDLVAQSAPSGGKKQKRQIHYPLPDWTERVPPNFLQRNAEFQNDKSVNMSQLKDEVRGRIAADIEKQMKGQHRLGNPSETPIDPDLSEVCLPALYMPTRRGVVYNARASKAIQPSGSELRLTQPPAIFQLPPLPGIADEYDFMDILGNTPFVQKQLPHDIMFRSYSNIEDMKPPLTRHRPTPADEATGMRKMQPRALSPWNGGGGGGKSHTLNSEQ